MVVPMVSAWAACHRTVQVDRQEITPVVSRSELSDLLVFGVRGHLWEVGSQWGSVTCKLFRLLVFICF